MADSSDGLEVEDYYRSFSAGSVLFRAGAPADALYLVREGRVRLSKRAGGVERTTGILGPGDLVGEDALIPGSHRTATAEAIETVTALVIESDTFRALTRKRPELADGVIRQLVLRLRGTEAELESVRVLDPTLRVLNTLLHAMDAEAVPVRPISLLELSDRAGLDLEQVQAVVGQLRDRGYLELEDQAVTVTRRAPLEALRDLLVLKEDVRNGLGCRSTDTPS
jgi:CRP-like cAMP-binding protein